MGKRDWLRCRQLVGASLGVVLGLSSLAGPVAGAAPATPAASPVAVVCDIPTTRTLDDIIALAERGLAERADRREAASPVAASPAASPVVTDVGTPAGSDPTLAALPGTPADPATAGAVVDTVALFVACINSGQMAGVFSVIEDDWVARQAAAVAYGFASAMAGEDVDPRSISPEVIENILTMLYYSSGPVPADQQLDLVPTGEVRDLGDGRFAAVVVSTDADGVTEESVIYLRRNGDRFELLDPSVDHSAVAATPVAP